MPSDMLSHCTGKFHLSRAICFNLSLKLSKFSGLRLQVEKVISQFFPRFPARIAEFHDVVDNML